MRKKKALLFSEGFGSGHTQAARALSISMRQYSPDVQTRVMELCAFQHPMVAPFVYNAYHRAVSSKPDLYGRFYRSQQERAISGFLRLALHRLFYAKTGKILQRLNPDFVVCTHPFPNAVIARLKEDGLRLPLYTVITDYDAHGSWINPGVDRYLVPTEHVKEKFVGRGVQPERIDVTGIPVHPHFWDVHDAQAVRQAYALKPLPTVLIMGGGWGMLEQANFLAQAAAWADKVQLLIVLGSNEKALARLSADDRFRHQNIRLIGFTREVDRLMDTADLLITKPGGMTCSEAIAKGIPMLFYQAFPGQEEANLHYFLGNGFGEEIDGPDTVNRWFGYLADHWDDFRERRLLRVSRDNRELFRHACARAILDELL